jgi:outer membrane lipoprotein
VLPVLFYASCSVISPQIKTGSEPSVSFKKLAQEEDKYKGKTVILGGYIQETKTSGNETIIEVLQVPLTFQDEPKSRDKSEGRLIVLHEGLLDPELYSRNRKITVAGAITDCVGDDVKTCTIRSREIYVWPEPIYDYRYDHGASEYDPFDSPFPANWY